MYKSLPNWFAANLKNDAEFQNLSKTVLCSLFDNNENIYAEKSTGNEPFAAKIFDNKNEKMKYLVVKKENCITVYEEIVYSGKTKFFEYMLEELKAGSYEIHAREVMYVPLEEKSEIGILAEKVKKYFNYMLKNKLSEEEQKEKEELESTVQYLKGNPEQDKQVIKALGKLYGNDFKCSSNPYKMKVFFQYLFDKGLLSHEISDDMWINKNEKTNQAANQKVDLLKQDIEFLFEVCDNKKFTNKKKYSFNDSDNFLYGVDKGIVLESQSMGSYITMKGNEITIYAFDKESEGFMKYTSLNSLIKAIDNNEAALIDSVILKMNDNEVEYVNNNTWYCLTCDLEFTRQSILENKLGKMNNPTDIQAFDYQLKFAQKSYGATKFEFLADKFMSYSSESNYDKKTGTFHSEDVIYDKEVHFGKVKEAQGIQEKFNYCIPMEKIPYLQKEWLEGLEYMVNVLKTDKPIPSVSNTKNKEKDIEDAIKHFELIIPQLKKKLNTISKLKS